MSIVSVMKDIFGVERALIGMVHVGAMPGTPGARRGDAGAVIALAAARAAEEAVLLAEHGFHGVIIENMHDVPYVHGAQGPEVVAGMTAVGVRVRGALPAGFPIGVQVLSGGNREAIAVACAAGGSFVRVENFVFAHVADEGLLERAEAGPLLRYRRAVGAEGISVWCDIKKKHASHAITGDVSVGAAARAAAFFGAEALIVTGAETGAPASEDDLVEARAATGLPVVVGSGATPGQMERMMRHADGVIVGSWIKKEGQWRNAVDAGRCAEVAAAFKEATGRG